MSDYSIRERHGVACRELGDLSQCSITIWETEDYIAIDGHHRVRALTAWQARYLAAKLYRLSRRIRDRVEGEP